MHKICYSKTEYDQTGNQQNGLNISMKKTSIKKTIYTTSLKATKDTKLQNFNYRVLIRIIPTNKFLLKCNIGFTALCDFCSKEIETLNQFFGIYSCTAFLDKLISTLTGIQ